ncbi:MAG: hypothetical protein EA351_13390 [Gemmatimonadales bacterium]|nr:MAG: hypothetical protein EA351_13390 [Gemmatimonadales bacterium]
MSTEESPYSPPAGSPPDPDEDLDRRLRREGPDDRLPPPVFTPVVGRRPLHRPPHLPPAGASLPPHAVYGPDDPPRARGEEPSSAAPPSQSVGDAREARARDLAAVLDRLAEELRVSGTLRFVPSPGSDTIEAALRGFLSGVLLSGARSGQGDPS